MVRRKSFPHFIILLLITIALILPSSNAFCEDSDIISYNTATAEELMAHEDLELSEDIAKAIVAYRKKNGPFKTPADLLKVPGITGDILEILNPVMSENGNDVVYDPDAEPALAPSKC
jgi:competence protein ComEA